MLVEYESHYSMVIVRPVGRRTCRRLARELAENLKEAGANDVSALISEEDALSLMTRRARKDWDAWGVAVGRLDEDTFAHMVGYCDR